MNTAPASSLPAAHQEPEVRPQSPDDALDRVCLAAPLLLSALLVILDGAASLRVPWRQVLPWLYLPTLVAVVVWLLAVLRVPGSRGRVALLLGLGVLAVYFSLAGLFGTWTPDPIHGITRGYDAWCYQALGDYLFNHPRGQLSGISMLDAYGASLRDTRFSSPGLLELVGSGVPFKDPPMSHFALAAIGLAVQFASTLYLGRVLLGSLTAAAGAAFLATAAGWTADALELANYDNLLFLALVPALVGVLVRLGTQPVRWTALPLAGGLLCAAVVETFPEGVPLVGVLLLPLVVWLGWRCVGQPRLLWSLLVLLGVGLLLALPYLPVFHAFLLNQIQWANATILLGNPSPFPGLHSERRLPAFFALGEEWAGGTFTVWHNVLPAVLLVLLGVGAWSWRHTHRWLPWVAVPLAALLLWQNGWKKFDYGTYKVLFCAAWWIYPTVVAGCAALVQSVRLPAWSLGWLLVLLASAIGWERAGHRPSRGRLPTNVMEPLRELTSLRFVTREQPLLLDLDDPLEHSWTLYYLRRQPITTFRQQGGLAAPGLERYLAQAGSPAPQTARFVLVKGTRPESLWSDGVFSVLPLPGAYIGSLDGPWGTESSPGDPDFIWIGARPETFRIRSNAEGDFELRATHVGIGPRAPHQDRISFEITDAAGTSQYEWRPGDATKFPLHLRAGENLVTVRCTEPPVPASPDGDQRDVMLQIRGYSVGPRD